jgi:hypothetical protein
MKLRKKTAFIAFVLVAVVGFAIATFVPISESTFEFDGVNLRSRECFRNRSWLFHFVLSEQCSEPQDHAAALRLRELGVLGPILEKESHWLLIQGYKTGVRRWRGPGRDYVRNLGATTFGAAVVLPAEEDLSENIWVKWAVKDPKGATHFWQELQSVAMKQPGLGGAFLRAAEEYLQEHKLVVVATDLEAHARHAIEY